MAKVTMPQLGESVAEGTIGKWLKQPGDHVAKYEPLLEVITDKVNAEVPSPFEGILQGDPGRGGRDRPEQRRDRDHRDGRRGPAARAASAPRPRAATPATGRERRPAVEPADTGPAAAAPTTAPAPAPRPAGPAGARQRHRRAGVRRRRRSRRRRHARRPAMPTPG